MKNIFALYQLGQFILCDDLIRYCRSKIHKFFTKKHCLSYAFLQDSYNDPDIFQLMKWFLGNDLTGFDVSNFNAEQALIAYMEIRKYGENSLSHSCLQVLIEKLKLNQTVEQLTQFLSEKNDQKLEKWYEKSTLSLQ